MTKHVTATATTPSHEVSIRCEPPSRDGALVRSGGHRARCSCGWSSDCYAQISDTQRAIEVHQRRARRSDFEGLIARSSIGAAIADIKARGIEAHLVDLEREMNRRWRGKKKRAVSGKEKCAVSGKEKRTVRGKEKRAVSGKEKRAVRR